MHRFATTIMIFALGLGYQLANAAPFQDTPAVIVHFADLHLTHGDGVAMLYQRLKGAAETVCASQDDRNGRDIGTQTRYKMCRQSALAAAVAKVEQPALTAYYRAHFKPSNPTIQVARH